jgi:hypothetical protein
LRFSKAEPANRRGRWWRHVDRAQIYPVLPGGNLAGLTHEELSFMAGLSRPYVSQLERDLKSPTVGTLFRLCDALEVSAASVIKRVDAARKGKPNR